jgi:hypothetical protein
VRQPLLQHLLEIFRDIILRPLPACLANFSCLASLAPLPQWGITHREAQPPQLSTSLSTPWGQQCYPQPHPQPVDNSSKHENPSGLFSRPTIRRRAVCGPLLSFSVGFICGVWGWCCLWWGVGFLLGGGVVWLDLCGLVEGVEFVLCLLGDLCPVGWLVGVGVLGAFVVELVFEAGGGGPVFHFDLCWCG